MTLPTKLVGPPDRQTRVYNFTNFPWVKIISEVGHLDPGCPWRPKVLPERLGQVWPCPQCVSLPKLEQPPQLAVPTGPHSGSLGSLLGARLARLASWVAHRSQKRHSGSGSKDEGG